MKRKNRRRRHKNGAVVPQRDRVSVQTIVVISSSNPKKQKKTGGFKKVIEALSGILKIVKTSIEILLLLM
jgi:hypothetical protein